MNSGCCRNSRGPQAQHRPHELPGMHQMQTLPCKTTRSVTRPGLASCRGRGSFVRVSCSSSSPDGGMEAPRPSYSAQKLYNLLGSANTPVGSERGEVGGAQLHICYRCCFAPSGNACISCVMYSAMLACLLVKWKCNRLLQAQFVQHGACNLHRLHTVCALW